MINEEIVLEAKRYLPATRNQIKEIADHLRYEDVSYFVNSSKNIQGTHLRLFGRILNKSYSTSIRPTIPCFAHSIFVLH
jgi:AraC-like DNA-binding protein